MTPRRPFLAIALPGLLAACSSSASSDPPVGDPVYYGEIDRILGDNCVACHSADEDRLAPFSLASYQDAVRAADEQPLTWAVTSRTMPPYYARDDGSCQTFRDNRWLSDADIDTLVAWSDGARLAGDPALASPTPPSPPALDRVDRVLDPGAEYTPDATVDDDYRCFVVDPALAADQFLTGFEVRPGNASVVHHAIVFALPDATAEADAVALDNLDAGLGYGCNGGVGVPSASFVIGWAPGGGVSRLPATTGIRVRGGRKLVLQIHYNLHHSDGRGDRTVVDLQLDDQVENEAAILSVRAPIDLPPGMVGVTTTGREDLPFPGVDGRLWGTAMHMHNRGMGGGGRRVGDDACLLDLTGWSFHWQHLYWYEQPVAVRGGDTIEVTCRYDTSADTDQVTWGEGTDEEMCILYMYLSR